LKADSGAACTRLPFSDWTEATATQDGDLLPRGPPVRSGGRRRRPMASSARSRAPVSVSGQSASMLVSTSAGAGSCPAWRCRWCGGFPGARSGRKIGWPAARARQSCAGNRWRAARRPMVDDLRPRYRRKAATMPICAGSASHASHRAPPPARRHRHYATRRTTGNRLTQPDCDLWLACPAQ
jgi:hypothetical protein